MHKSFWVWLWELPTSYTARLLGSKQNQAELSTNTVIRAPLVLLANQTAGLRRP
jgi:hypothetical protein